MMRLTDFAALLGIDLVVCAILLGLVLRLFPAVLKIAGPGERINGRAVWFLGGALMFFWTPAGPSMLPLLAYVRGIASDLSITSVILACLTLRRQLGLRPEAAHYQYLRLYVAITLAACVLYPTALGWGDWDAYRLGWGSPVFFAALAIFTLAAFCAGLRLVTFVIAASVLAWAAGWLESGNLWDYLLDPWVVLLSFWHLLAAGSSAWRRRLARA